MCPPCSEWWASEDRVNVLGRGVWLEVGRDKSLASSVLTTAALDSGCGPQWWMRWSGWLNGVGEPKVYSKFGLRTCSMEKHRGCWSGWRSIWKLKVQQRIKIFMWILAHDKLRTNHGCWRTKLTKSPYYLCCDEGKKYGLHAVKDCPHSKEVCVGSE